MQNFLWLVALFFLSFLMGCGAESKSSSSPPLKLEKAEVDVACGMCKFGLKARRCELALKVDGAAYHVDGVEAQSEEEMHSEGGICVTVRRAVVSGSLEKGRFQASSYELLDMK